MFMNMHDVMLIKTNFDLLCSERAAMEPFLVPFLFRISVHRNLEKFSSQLLYKDIFDLSYLPVTISGMQYYSYTADSHCLARNLVPMTTKTQLTALAANMMFTYNTASLLLQAYSSCARGDNSL